MARRWSTTGMRAGGRRSQVALATRLDSALGGGIAGLGDDLKRERQGFAVDESLEWVPTHLADCKVER